MSLIRPLLCLLVFWVGHCDRRIAYAASPSFRHQIAPLLIEHCIACHGPKKAEGGYRADTFEQLSKPGDSGMDPLKASEGMTAELLRRLQTDDPSERMPAESEPLPAESIAAVAAWLHAGGAFDGDDPRMPLHLAMPPREYGPAPETYGFPIPITALAFSPDGAHLIASGYHELTVWQATDGQRIRRIGNLPERTYAISLFDGGKLVAVGGGDPGRSGDVRIVDLQSGSVLSVVARSHDVIFDVAIRPDEKMMAVAAADGLIRLIDLTTRAEVRTIASHADWVYAVAWNDDGTRLISGSRDKSTKVFDASNGELLTSYQGHTSAVRGVAFAPDGKHAVSTSQDQKMHVWEIEGGKRIAEENVGSDSSRLVRSGTLAIVPCNDKQLRCYDLATRKLTFAVPGHQAWITSAAVHAATGQIASGGLDGEIHLWNASNGAAVRHWTGSF